MTLITPITPITPTRRHSATFAALFIAGTAFGLAARYVVPVATARAQSTYAPDARYAANGGDPRRAAFVPAATPSRDLAGEWRVDLRPTPNASATFTTLTITRDADGKYAGRFYGSELKEMRVNADWGDARFAFVTYDASGPYHTSARLVDGRLEGTTHALGRGFLSVWTARREAPEGATGVR